MAPVLITGGTGFIGSNIVQKCVEAGDRVRVLARGKRAEGKDTPDLDSKGVEVIRGSITDREAARRACAGVKIVYHFAAAHNEANVPDSYFREMNIEGTRIMLDAAVEAGVKRFVHASTIGVYGAGRNGTVTEDSPLEPDSIYGVTKLAGEALVRTYSEELPITILRISETYGPGDRRLLKLYRSIARGRFVKIGAGRNLHHPVYIDDLVDCLRLAAVHSNSMGQTFVIAGPQALTTDEMIAAISRSLGKKPPALRVPLWPLMGTAFVLEGLLRPVGIQPPLHRRRMQFFVKSFRFDGRAAREAIGYQPKIGFEEGARRTIAWYQGANLL